MSNITSKQRSGKVRNGGADLAAGATGVFLFEAIDRRQLDSDHLKAERRATCVSGSDLIRNTCNM